MEPWLIISAYWMLHYSLEYLPIHRLAPPAGLSGHAGDAELLAHLSGDRDLCFHDGMVLAFWVGRAALVQGAE